MSWSTCFPLFQMCISIQLKSANSFLFRHFILFIRKAERERDEEKSSILSFLPKCLQQAGLYQAESRSQELSWSLPCAWQATQTWAITCAAFQSTRRQEARNRSRGRAPSQVLWPGLPVSQGASAAAPNGHSYSLSLLSTPWRRRAHKARVISAEILTRAIHFLFFLSRTSMLESTLNKG